MMYEIIQRLALIQRNEINVKAAEVLPDALDSALLPLFVNTIRRVTPEANLASEINGYALTVQMRLYIAESGTRGKAVNQFDAYKLFDTVMDTFSARPRLEYNDTGLNGLMGRVSPTRGEGFDGNLRYPVNYSQGTPYWGFLFELSVTTIQTIQQEIG